MQNALRVEVPAEDIAAERKNIIKLYSSKAKIPGFRAGKIPAAVIEKRYKEEIEGELENRAVSLCLKQGNEEEKLEIIRVIRVTDQSHNPDGTFTFTTEVLTAPQFELPEYKGIQVKVPPLDVTDEQLAEALDQMRERFSDYKDIEDRSAAMGDFAVINYKGSIDGSPIGEIAPAAPATIAQNTGFWLRMDEGTFLPGFCAALVGANNDDTKEISVTIPDNFPDEQLRGQQVDYSVEIVGLKEQVLPELNDDFAAKIEAGKTLDEVKDSLRNQMLDQRKGYRQELITNQVLDKLNSELDFELPKEIVQRETQSRVDEIVNSNSERGIAQEEIVQNQEKIIQAAGQQAALSVRTSFIIEQIAEAEDIKVDRDELMGRVAEIAARNNTPVKKLFKQLQKQDGFGRIHSSLRIQKTIAFLRDSAVIEEVEPEETGK